jgi:hypothetical protein
MLIDKLVDMIQKFALDVHPKSTKNGMVNQVPLPKDKKCLGPWRYAIYLHSI